MATQSKKAATLSTGPAKQWRRSPMQPLPLQRPPTSGKIVIVDGFSSGNLLAPAFRRVGCSSIHVHSSPEYPAGYEASFRPADYDYDIIHRGDHAQTLAAIRRFTPRAVVTGSEPGVHLSDYLSETLGVFSNGTHLSEARRDKLVLGTLFESLGLPAVKQYASSALVHILEWARKQDTWPVVIKPLASFGTDGVVICNSEAEITTAFYKIYGKMNDILLQNEQVLIQAFLQGIEYALNTVSGAGRHLVTDIWKYERRVVPGTATAYVHDVLLPFDGEIQRQLIKYGFNALNALGITYGAGHLEMIMTSIGAVMVDAGARMCGAMFPRIVGEATGQSQVSHMVDAYLYPDLFAQLQPGYELMKHAAVIFLGSDGDGTHMSYQILEKLKDLPGVHAYEMHFDEGNALPQTINSDTVIGTIELLHEDQAALDAAMSQIHLWEREGAFETLD